MQEQGQVRGLLCGELVLAGEEQNPVVEEGALLAPRNHGQKAVARGLHGQDPLAGKTGRHERPVHPGSHRERNQSRRRRESRHPPAGPQESRARRGRGRARENQNPRGRQMLREEEMEKHARDRRAHGLRHVDGQGLLLDGASRRGPGESKPAERAGGQERDKRHGKQRRQRGLLPEGIRPREASQPERGQQKQRRHPQHERQAPRRGQGRSRAPGPERARQGGQAEPGRQGQSQHELVTVRRGEDLAQQHHLRQQGSRARDRDGLANRGSTGVQLHTPGIVNPQNAQRPFLMCRPSSSKPRRATTTLPQLGQVVSSPARPGTLPV